MVDPVTVGSLVAGALGMAADAALKSAVGEAIKDGYHALKDKVSHWASGDVAALEAVPSSKGRQAVVAEIIDAQSDDDKQALRILAETLVARLKDSAPAIGLDIGRLTALEGRGAQALTAAQRHEQAFDGAGELPDAPCAKPRPVDGTRQSLKTDARLPAYDADRFPTRYQRIGKPNLEIACFGLELRHWPLPAFQTAE